MTEPRAFEFKHQRGLVLGLLGGLLTVTLVFGWLAFRSPNVSYLAAHRPGHWIVYPTVADGTGLPAVEMSSEFRQTFSLAKDAEGYDGSHVILSVRAFKRCQIVVNGKNLDLSGRTNLNWKDASEFNIAPFWHSGTNEISITVFNDYGPPALWACIDTGWQEWVSDQSWEVSYAGAAWKPARLAETPMRIGKGNALDGGETVGSALAVQWPHFLLFAVITAGLLLAGRWWLNRPTPAAGVSPLLAPERWPALTVGALALAWAALFANNVALLPPKSGFDIAGHLDYISYILQWHRLPLSNEGFEMYQPPLYYLIGAGLLGLFRLTPSDPNGIIVLRCFALACGIVTFTAAFLSARLVFPGQPRKQFFALLLAALIPTNLYIYQYATNELLATTMAALSVYACLRILKNPALSVTEHAWFGLALGGALLTKSSAVVLPPVLFGALVWNVFHLRRSRRREEAEIAESGSAMSASSASSCRRLRWVVCLGAALLVCIATAGWHYVRVARHFGNPLVGNWDAILGFHWWQQPGYRTSAYYTHFGTSLWAPLFSSFRGIADGVYSTLWGDSLYGGLVEILIRQPWNYNYMVAGYLFALLPTVAILAGAAIWLYGFIRKPASSGFAVLGVAATLALLLLYYSFRVPVYASSKAFYASAALVPVCLLGAAGWNFLCRWAGRFRVVLYVWLGVWAMTTYATYWIRRDSPHTLGLVARSYSDAGHPDVAVARLKDALRRYPHDTQLTLFLLFELVGQGKQAEAATLARETLTFAETNSDLHLELGTALAAQGNLDAGIREGRHAIELAPEDYLAGKRLTEWLKTAGRRDEAIDACREALRVIPSNGQLHYLLGTLLQETGDATNAIAQVRLAMQLDTDLTAVGHDRLGQILQQAGRIDEAVAEFAVTVKLRPNNADCWFRLAQAFMRQGKIAPAIQCYRQSLALNPNSVQALGGLAWQLATQPDAGIRNGTEAVQLASHAVELTGRKNAQCLMTLSAAYAETERFDWALSTVNEAMALAGKNGESGVVEMGRNLIQRYQEKEAYRQ